MAQVRGNKYIIQNHFTLSLDQISPFKAKIKHQAYLGYSQKLSFVLSYQYLYYILYYFIDTVHILKCISNHRLC